MWVAHCIVLNKLPAAERLAELRGGYQLYREKATGLYFLTAYSDPPCPYPDLGGSLERTKVPRADLSALKDAIAQAADPFDIAKGEIDFRLVDQAVALSATLDQSVLVCEVTDDGIGMAVQAAAGAVPYLCFLTCLGAGTAGERLVQAVYRPGRGVEVANRQSDEIGGLAQAAIEEVFGVPGIHLYAHTEAEPPKGAFRRVGKAAPQLTPLEKLARPFLALGSRIVAPVIMIGMLRAVFYYAGKPGKEPPEFTPLQFFLVGAAVLAVPIAIVVLAVLWLVVT